MDFCSNQNHGEICQPNIIMPVIIHTYILWVVLVTAMGVFYREGKVKNRKVLHLRNLDPQLNAADIEVSVLNNHIVISESANSVMDSTGQWW